jgi:hypothetical protein
MNIFKRVVQRKTQKKNLRFTFRFSKAFSLLLGAQSGDNKLAWIRMGEDTPELCVVILRFLLSDLLYHARSNYILRWNPLQTESQFI